jgi:hypothetical protein
MQTAETYLAILRDRGISHETEATLESRMR